MRAIALIPMTLAVVFGVSPPKTASPLVGTWRLVSFESRDENGGQILPMGSEPVGQLMYDNAGNMSVQLMRPARTSFASADRLSGTDSEVRAAFEGYHAYFGRYAVDDQARMVTHYIDGASFPNLVGSKQVRAFAIVGNRLTLSTPPIQVGGRSVTSELVWERAEHGAAPR